MKMAEGKSFFSQRDFLGKRGVEKMLFLRGDLSFVSRLFGVEESTEGNAENRRI